MRPTRSRPQRLLRGFKPCRPADPPCSPWPWAARLPPLPLAPRPRHHPRPCRYHRRKPRRQPRLRHPPHHHGPWHRPHRRNQWHRRCRHRRRLPRRYPSRRLPPASACSNSSARCTSGYSPCPSTPARSRSRPCRGAQRTRGSIPPRHRRGASRRQAAGHGGGTARPARPQLPWVTAGPGLSALRALTSCVGIHGPPHHRRQPRPRRSTCAPRLCRRV